MIRLNPSSALSVASIVAAPMRPCVKVSLPRSTPREASSTIRIAPPASSSATRSRMELAPMSITATTRGASSPMKGLLPREPPDVSRLDGRLRVLELHGDAQRRGDQIEAPPGPPHLELDVPRGQADDPDRAAPRPDDDGAHGLAVAPVERVGELEEPGEDPDDATRPRREGGEPRVLPSRRPAPVVA